MKTISLIIFIVIFIQLISAKAALDDKDIIFGHFKKMGADLNTSKQLMNKINVKISLADSGNADNDPFLVFVEINNSSVDTIDNFIMTERSFRNHIRLFALDDSGTLFDYFKQNMPLRTGEDKMRAMMPKEDIKFIYLSNITSPQVARGDRFKKRGNCFLNLYMVYLNQHSIPIYLISNPIRIKFNRFSDNRIKLSRSFWDALARDENDDFKAYFIGRDIRSVSGLESIIKVDSAGAYGKYARLLLSYIYAYNQRDYSLFKKYKKELVYDFTGTVFLNDIKYMLKTSKKDSPKEVILLGNKVK